MALEKITQVTGRGVNVPGDDIDTDRIIPARFMKCVTFDGLGEFAFYDVRFDPATGERVDQHPLNQERFQGAKFLLSGSNFGCGSSREHAPQALYRYGFRAILAESYAEIFFGNSTTLGIPCAVMSQADISALAGLIEADPEIMITLDLLEGKVTAGDMDFPANVPAASREVLVEGKWDAIADLLEGTEAIKATASKLAYFQNA
jgi:3-isopropylmalate/(R)-2-methylmalate dehydratase small subunit